MFIWHQNISYFCLFKKEELPKKNSKTLHVLWSLPVITDTTKLKQISYYQIRNITGLSLNLESQFKRFVFPQINNHFFHETLKYSKEQWIFFIYCFGCYIFYEKFVLIVRRFLMHSSDHNTDPSFPIPSNFRQSTVEPQYNEMPREQ